MGNGNQLIAFRQNLIELRIKTLFSSCGIGKKIFVDSEIRPGIFQNHRIGMLTIDKRAECMGKEHTAFCGLFRRCRATGNGLLRNRLDIYQNIVKHFVSVIAQIVSSGGSVLTTHCELGAVCKYTRSKLHNCRGDR